MSVHLPPLIVLNHVTLSHYITDTATYFTYNVTFIFMEGEHLLDKQGLVQVVINHVDNLTLKGKRHHSNTSIIKCSSNTRGLQFKNCNIINMYDIDITGCGQENISPLSFINITSLYIHHSRLYNNNGSTLYIYCASNMHIIVTNSGFNNNTVGVNGSGGGLYIHSGTEVYNEITITDSAFTSNTIGVNGGGLIIHSDAGVHNDITIANNSFTNNNIGVVGGGILILTSTKVYNQIIITNNTFAKNTVGSNGGGLFIQTDTDVHNDITITDSAFTKNIVGGDGGGLYIQPGTDTYNNIIIINSMLTSSIVGNNGGGLLIYLATDTHNNIIITNSVFTDNTIGTDGGGQLIYSDPHGHNNINLFITNSRFTKNVVGDDGGGMYLHSGTNSHYNLIIVNSTITNNAVGDDGGGLLMFSNIDTYNNITVTNSAFNENTVGDVGGGLHIYSQPHMYTYNNVIITNSTFTKNVVNNDGAGLYIHSGTDTYYNITITNSTITNNTVGDDGGGLLVHSNFYTYTNVMITNSAFTNNRVWHFGGGLYIFIESGTGTCTNVTITNGIFTNNRVGRYGGGLFIKSDTDAYNKITVNSSMFTYNVVGNKLYSDTFLPESLTMSGGGLYIDSNNDTHNSITIANSIFTNNTVGEYGGGLYLYFHTDTHNNIAITNSTFLSNKGGINGGGLAIYSHTNTLNSIVITNSTFVDNVASYDGGGLIIFSLINTHDNITITSSNFTSNMVGRDGGGLFVYSRIGTHKNVIISNSTFSNNRASNNTFLDSEIGHGNGGGLYIYSGINTHNNVITINSSTCINNTANHIGGGLLLFFATKIPSNDKITIANSTLAHNNGGGLILYSINHIEVVLTKIIVTNNNGSGILVISQCTLIFTEGHSTVANNTSPTNGGGIHLGQDSYLTTSNGGHVSFIDNIAHRYGGAIYSKDEDHHSLLHAPFSFPAYYMNQCTVHDLSATFINNSAVIAGDQLYGGIFICQQNISEVNMIKCTHVPTNIKNASSVHPLSPVSSYPLAVCPCVNGTVDCSVTSLDSEAYPGQIFHVSLVTVGLCGGVSPGTVVVKHDNNISLMSSTTTDYTSTSCTMLNYTVRITKYISNTTLIFNIADSDFYNIRSVKVHLSILPCPLGLALDSISGECICNNQIHVSQVFCNISWMPYPIQRSGNNWISNQYNKYNCTIAHIGCPFDYCNTSSVKFSLSESDLQCNYNRSGILCGQCQPGLSLVIGSNRCTNCTDTTALISVSIVIMAATAGIVLVIFLILLNLTVSIGSINGLLFYANVVKLNESIFFSQGNIPVINQFISWCNLDLGIEYCFMDGLDGYVKTWLQFVFPLYVWVLVIVIIVGCRYSSRLSRLCGRNALPVLATLILMSYTKLSCAVTNALMMNTLQCGEHKWSVLNVDGNINYLSGKHIALFTVSLLFLVIGLVYTGLVFSSQWLQRYSGKCCKSTRDPVVQFKPLIDAYTGPFKDKYRFWTGLCLIVRLILTVVFSFTTPLQSKLNNYIIILTVGGMSMFRVYKDKRLNILESLSLFNVICLSVITILFTESYHDKLSINLIVSISVSMEILLFIILVTAHSYLVLKKVFPKFQLCYNTDAVSEEELRIPLIANDNCTEEGSPAHIITRKEGLIFEFYLSEQQS